MGKEHRLRGQLNGKNEISISLIGQLPTCKKDLFDTMRKIPFSWEQGQGQRSQGSRVRASNALCCLQPPTPLSCCVF